MQRRSKTLGWAGSNALSITISVVILLAAWQGAVSLLAVPPYVLPSPLAVLDALRAGVFMDPTQRASFIYQLASTIYCTLLGFLIGGGIGVIVAAIMTESTWLRRIIFPYVVGLQSLPKIAIAPLIIIWFGYGTSAKIAMASMGVIFPVLLNALEGFSVFEQERLELMTSLKASRWQAFWMIRLPSALPFIFAGLNLGIVYAFLGAIIAEFVGSQRGIGVVIMQLQSIADTAGVFAALILLTIAGYLLLFAVRLVQHRVVFWSGIAAAQAAAESY
jgi:NitT/TauT family transport system permease protein